jgi:hypothetical protein
VGFWETMTIAVILFIAAMGFWLSTRGDELE